MPEASSRCVVQCTRGTNGNRRGLEGGSFVTRLIAGDGGGLGGATGVGAPGVPPMSMSIGRCRC
eukprot:9486921-Pyramimonas_sp.AAC.1